jgi:hypothetical protein
MNQTDPCQSPWYEAELRRVVIKACDNYLRDIEWKPDILRHFSGYLFFTLLRDYRTPVNEVSVNLHLDGLAAIIVLYGGIEKKNALTWVYEIKKEGTGFVATPIHSKIGETIAKNNST